MGAAKQFGKRTREHPFLEFLPRARTRNFKEEPKIDAKPKKGDRRICTKCGSQMPDVDKEFIDFWNKLGNVGKSKFFEMVGGEAVYLDYCGCRIGVSKRDKMIKMILESKAKIERLEQKEIDKMLKEE